MTTLTPRDSSGKFYSWNTEVQSAKKYDGGDYLVIGLAAAFGALIAALFMSSSNKQYMVPPTSSFGLMLGSDDLTPLLNKPRLPEPSAYVRFKMRIWDIFNKKPKPKSMWEIFNS